MFWVDEIVEDIIKKENKKNFLITDWKTPSGNIHVGALRGVIIHDLIKRGLSEKGKEAQFEWGYDDFDPMDGIPIYIDQSWKKYMGMPLCNIPAPDGKSKNYADEYSNEFTEVLKKLNIRPKIVKSSDLYRGGYFNDTIKIILDNADEIRKIYKEVSRSEKLENWYPLQVVCPKCEKVGTTIVTEWDGSEVTFECRKDLVKWAEGCGYQGKISPFDGNGKMSWKTEWPSKWYVTKSDIEGEGKDHSAASGSRDVANNIFRNVFKKVPPYDIAYEFFLIGGAKMSSSKGLGVTAKDIADFLPTNILRFLFTRTKYKRAIDFQPENDTIPLLYDEFDRCAEEYQKDPKSNFARAYYYSITSSDNIPKYKLRFSKIAYMLQMPKIDIIEYAKNEKQSDLTDIEIDEINNRIDIAKKWLKLYAPESFKFEIQEKLPEKAKNLSAQQKEFLKKISGVIKSNDLSGEELHKKIHEIKSELKISPRDAFSAIYLSFIGKDSGPQAGWLLAGLDKKFAIRRLEEVSR